jgi:N-formylglutamate amidohydrolase
LGYNVHRNRPYAGGFITEHYGRPGAGRHAVQIEVARSLYMDESRLEPNDQFPLVAKHLREAIGELLRAIGEGGADQRLAAE